ncbi:hypothetical protein [Brevundimonas sp.]|uniref:hypothetical protein n=1 Tax=Brevundimonas sp. TaxID=1871086 RepID=UPI002D304420|nr:hypothetical protein [Brevundimonas sp.]HYD28902.1 hypothetical protein [Brevundimonas sp.]
MTNETEARVAPAAEPALLTEHVNVLMTEETRAFLLGSKIADGARSEGAVARALLEDAIESYRTSAVLNAEYDRRIKLGRAELIKRAGTA